MMRWIRKKEGFTLIELLIVILTGTIVTAAATTILLLAFRINRKSMDTIGRQSIMRIMLSVVEDMGSDGEFVFVNNAVENSNGDLEDVEGLNSWSINKVEDDGSPGDAVISYNSLEGTIQAAGGAALVDKVSDSLLYKTYTPFDYVRDLYTFSVEIQGKEYRSAVYSRTQEKNWRADDPALDFEDGRNTLVRMLSSQVGSTNYIVEDIDTSYVEWYASNYAPSWTTDDIEFVEAKPWCGCFASWALHKTNGLLDGEGNPIVYLNEIPQEANVNFLWMRSFATTDSRHIKINDHNSDLPNYHTPKPGDLIFFEYNNDNPEDFDGTENLSGLENTANYDDSLCQIVDLAVAWEKTESYINTDLHYDSSISLTEKLAYENYIIDPVNDPEEWVALRLVGHPKYELYNALWHFYGCVGDGLDHVGVVVKVEDGFVYTIEGSVPNDSDTEVVRKVALQKYDLTDSRIFGYAELDWNEDYK